MGALRLGKRATLITRPKSRPKVEYRLDLEWSRFDDAHLVEDIPLDIVEMKRTPQSPSGSEVIINDLAFAWRPEDVSRLARAMLLLADPFGGSDWIYPAINRSKFAHVVARAGKGYFADCDYHFLVSTIDSSGKGSAEVSNASGDIQFRANHRSLGHGKENPKYQTPAITFELWEFALDGKRFSTRNVRITSYGNGLKNWGGNVYHRGLPSCSCTEIRVMTG